MATLKALKMRISSVKSTQKITKAMKMVAAAKLRRAQLAAEAARPYSERMAAVVASVVSRVTIGPESPKLLAGTGKDDTHLLIVCTSDRGLAGGFNSNIVRAARRKAETLIGEGKQVYFYLVGRKGRAVIARLYPKQIIHQHDTSAIKQLSFADAQEIAADLVERYQTDGIDVVHLFYARFRSALVQEPVGQQIIPVPTSSNESAPQLSIYIVQQGDTLNSIAQDQLGQDSSWQRILELNRDSLTDPDSIYVGMKLKIPVTGSRARSSAVEVSLAAVEYEPDQEEILAALLPRNVAVQIFRALLENAASEQGSRMTAMDNATRNAGDMINRLTIQYNRTRQAAITKELIEIISGAEAL